MNEEKKPEIIEGQSPLVDPAVRELLDHLAKTLAKEYVRVMRESEACGLETGGKQRRKEE